jgi:type II secretory pathway pseudopilin PulG
LSVSGAPVRADSSFVRARLGGEKGFGLIELVFAMLLLNIGILSLVGAFQSGALSIVRTASSSNGTAVADKVMEVYRDIRNCGIYLHGGTGNDASGYPDGIPNSTSSFYSAYHADTAAYAGGTYYNNGTPSSSPLWVNENATGSGYTPIPVSNAACLPTNIVSSTGVDPSKAVQLVTGPDGQSYTVFSYILIVQPAGSGGAKQVTVKVFDPRNSAKALARESAVFDPNTAP